MILEINRFRNIKKNTFILALLLVFFSFFNIDTIYATNTFSEMCEVRESHDILKEDVVVNEEDITQTEIWISI